MLQKDRTFDKKITGVELMYYYEDGLEVEFPAWKMKILIYIAMFLTFSLHVSGQEWRDTLREARNAYTQKHYDQSFRLYRSASKLAPKEIDLSDEVAQSAYKAGKYEEAEKIYGQSSSVKGSSAQKAMIHRQIGNAQMKQKKYAEAIESYKESLRSNPADEHSRYNLSEAMRKQKAQQEQQKKQDKQQDQRNQQQKNNDPGAQNQNQPEKRPDGRSNNSQSSGNNQSQPQSQEQSQNSSQNQKNKLSDKKTERMLDKLIKQEMETKRKFEGARSNGKINKSGKDW